MHPRKSIFGVIYHLPAFLLTGAIYFAPPPPLADFDRLGIVDIY